MEDIEKDKVKNPLMQVGVTYEYSYEVAGEQFKDKVVLELTLRSTTHNHVAVRAERVEGSQLYFKKAVQGLKQKCFPN